MNQLITPWRKRYVLPAGLTTGMLLLQALNTPAAAQLLAANMPAQNAASKVSAPQTVALKTLLSQWENDYHVTIFYESKLVSDKQVVVQPAETSLETKLEAVLPQADLQFKKLRDNYFVVTARQNTRQSKTAAVRVQDVTISGRVTQKNGDAIPGVTVLVKGTSIGATTGADGSFQLTAPEGSTLVFSSVGFVRQEIPVAGASSPLTVVLAEGNQDLSEVVVVGYGTQTRESLTTAVSSVSAREIAAVPVADPTQALQGRAAGVTVTQNGGSPGGASGTSVRIRGLTSTGYNDPLYVVDGFPLPSGSDSQLNSISPNDIETIDILKDASATAIYGVRAANGVVVITTKRGKAGRSTVNLDVYRGFQNVWKKLDLLNAEQYATLNNESRTAGGLPPQAQLANPASLGAGTNWQNEIFRRAKIQNYALSATGGSDKARYALSAAYFQQDGTIINSNFQRFTLRANGDVEVNKVLKIGNSLAVTHTEDNQISSNNAFGIVSLALTAIPTVPVYRPDGSFYEPGAADGFIEANPVQAAVIGQNKFARNRITGTVYAELEPIKGLRFRTNVGADLIFENGRSFTPLVPNSARYTLASLNQYNNYNPSYLIENTATYDHTFAQDHHFTLLAGQSSQQFDFSNLNGSRAGYLRNDLLQLGSGPINTFTQNGGGDSQERIASYFGRFNYDYKGKYLLSAVLRSDGSYKFQPGRRFGTFPGISAAWRISEEAFLQGNRIISDLKLRGGYGRTGNQVNAGSFSYLFTINNNIQYSFGTASDVFIGSAPTRLANADLRWENNAQGNIGIDAGFLNNKILATIDVYNRRSSNLIVGVPVSLVSGTYESINTNAADAYNRGLDFSLTTRNIEQAGDGFRWSTNLNFSTYKTRITSLGTLGAAPFNGAGARNGAIVRYDAGLPIGAFYGFVADGIFQSADEVSAANAGAATKTGIAGTFFQKSGTAPGDIRFKDINGDGVVNDNDRTLIGNPNPSFTYGVTNNFFFKGFDLTVFIQGVQGNDVYNANRYYTEGGLYSNGNAGALALNRWTPTNPGASVPRAVANDPNDNLRISSYYVEKGSYMRIKNLALGYTLPASVLKRLTASQIRVYVSSQNLLTSTKYTGFDPEVGGGGIEIGTYPQPRTFIAGVNIGF